MHVIEEIKCADGSTLPYRGVVELTLSVPALKGDLVSALFLVVLVTNHNKTVTFIVGTSVIREYQKLEAVSENAPESWMLAFKSLIAQHVGFVKTTNKVP